MIYTPAELNPLLKDRKSTMPVLDGPADPQRPAEGWPAEPWEILTITLMRTDDGELHLIGLVTEKQAKEDQAQYFDGAGDYVERVAFLNKARPDIFTKVPYNWDHLTKRLARNKAIQRFIDENQSRTEAAAATLRTEWADLIRMADIMVVEIELELKRPTLSDKERRDLSKLCDFVLKTWRARMAKIQQTKDLNAQQRDELLAANEKLQAETAKHQTPVPVTVAVPQLPVDDGPHTPGKGPSKGKKSTTANPNRRKGKRNLLH